MRRTVFSLHDLPAWCALNDVKFRNVKIEEVAGRGYGLVTEADVPSGGADAMLEIPQDLVLSAQAIEDYAKIDQNFRDLLEKAGRQSHRADILLYLLMQMTLSSPDFPDVHGVNSAWTQYVGLLPSQIPVPTTWSEAERVHLKGTSLESAVSAKLTALTREFDAIKEKSDDLRFWYDNVWAEERVTIHDWVLLDAIYRSRSLELPSSGESMVPCLDIANHSTQATARFEETAQDQVTLVLKDSLSISKGQEVTIDYGQGKSAAEMLFSYGFIDPDCQAGKLVLPLEPMEDDPLAKAKMHIFRAPPTIQVTDGVDGVPGWSAPFAYLACLNEEDGLNFAVVQETDGSQELKLYWQNEDATDRSHDLNILIEGHELYKIFELRVVTVVLERLQQQLEELKTPVNSSKYSGPPREDIVRTATHLRVVEQDLLERMIGKLEGQRDELFLDDSVLAYLGSMEPTPSDEGRPQATDDNDEDFS
ncbi:hypothetical protein PG993_001654 [Apiospora rasikravindrae]|uniref:SET domain-containing protein n=1 Tax=Apiospora rasikravindrae TaxID=990691 RepID=A0ABR1UC02_9PEZI